MAVTVRGLPSRVEDAVRRTLAGAELPVVVAGAGLQARASFLELEQGEWLAAVDAVRHAFLAARQAAAAWLEAETPGRIIFVVSAASVRTLQGSALDATAGGFLTTLAQVGAVELGGKGITVNVVAHGWLEGEPDELVEGIPAGRLGPSRRRRGSDRVPRVAGRLVRQRRRADRRRRLLDHEDRRREPAAACDRTPCGVSSSAC